MALCVWVCVQVQAQSTQSGQRNRKYTLQWEETNYEEALQQLARQSGITFFYSPDYLPSDRFSARLDSVTMDQALTYLLTPIGIRFTWRENGIVLTRKKAKRVPVTVSGFITDALSGEALPGASLICEELQTGAVANPSGFFSLTLDQGTYQLKAYSLGYLTAHYTLRLYADTVLPFALEPMEIRLREVTVFATPDTSTAQTRVVRSLQPGSFQFNAGFVRQVPMFLGEADPVRTLQLLPGIQSGADGNAGFFVRGGGADQNLILIDDMPIYNISHLLGFFSVLNPDALKQVSFYKDGFLARYGGRLSSVLDVQLKEGNTQKRTFTGGIGSVASRLTFEQPLPKEKGSLMLAMRRTYLDFLFRNIPNNFSTANTLYFGDVNLKAHYRTGQKGTLSVSAFASEDQIGLGTTLANNWRNQAASLRWKQAIGQRWFLSSTAYITHFNARASVGLIEEFGYQQRYSLRDLGWKGEVNFFPTSGHVLEAGAELIHHRYFFGEVRPLQPTSVVRPSSTEPVFTVESAAFLSWRKDFGRRLQLAAGLRYSRSDNVGPGTVFGYNVPSVISPETGPENISDTTRYARGEFFHYWHGLEPRLTLTFPFANQRSAHVRYTRTRQYAHQLSNSILPAPIDMWAPAGPYIRPQIADQVSAGMSVPLGGGRYELTFDVYHKEMQNQLEFKSIAQLLFNNHLETEVLQGQGRAWGTEWLLKKQVGHLTGWLSYTLARSVRTIPGINNGEIYPAFFDRRHQVNAVANWELSPRLLLSATWTYASGQAFTVPVGKYEIDGFIVPYYTTRNGFRLPPVHRLDLSLTFYRKSHPEQKNESSFNFSLYNAYGRKNTFAYVFRQSKQDPTRTEAVKLYLFSVMPSFTYNFKF